MINETIVFEFEPEVVDGIFANCTVVFKRDGDNVVKIVEVDYDSNVCDHVAAECDRLFESGELDAEVIKAWKAEVGLV
jgi:hypothetical protein